MSSLRTKWFPWTLIIGIAIAIVVACASQNASDEESDEEATTAEEKADKNTADELADITDGKTDADKKDDAAKTADNAKADGKDDLTELENLESKDIAKKDTPNPNAAATDKKSEANLDETILGQNNDAKAPIEASAAPVPPKPGPAPKAAHVMAEVPKIPAGAITRKGVSLNRFYFARKGDTPEKVSHLLYGSKEQAKDLKRWNSGTWHPGKLVYYVSPTQPQDTEMRSFYQERNVTPAEYTVKKGETLNRIAQKQLGDRGSWKEIAVVNGLTENHVQPDQRLAIYSADLQAYGVQSAAGSQTVAKNAPEVPAPQTPTPAETPTPAPATKPAEASAPTTPAADPNQMTPQPQGLNFRRLIDQNMPAAMLLAGVLTLAIILMLVNKRKKARANDELADESFSPPKSGLKR